MKSFGKKVLLSGIILSVIGGGASGISDTVGAQKKVNTVEAAKTTTKKTTTKKTKAKKIDYTKLRAGYAGDLKILKVKDEGVSDYLNYLADELKDVRYFETEEMKQLRLSINKKLPNVISDYDSLNKRTLNELTKLKNMDTVKETKEMDAAIDKLISDEKKLRLNVTEVLKKSSRHRELVDVTKYESKKMFKELYPNTVFVNGSPDEFSDMIESYSRNQLIKKGRDYAKLKLDSGYSQDVVTEWYLNEFYSLLENRYYDYYTDLINIDESKVSEFSDLLFARKFEEFNSGLDDYNKYVDKLKRDIDELIAKDLKKVVIK